MSIIFSKCFPSSFSMKENLGKKKTKQNTRVEKPDKAY